MGYGVRLHLALDDIYDGQKYYIHGFNAREPLGNLMCQIMRPGDSAIAVGANVGYFTAMLSLLAGEGGKVFAVEAAPRTYERLQTLVRHNPHGNILTFPYAVADANGQVELSLGPPDHTGVSSLRDLSRLHAERVTVPSRTLDSMLPELPRIRLVKIDVEGAEMLVLRGMEKLLARDRPHLLVEVTDSFLRSLGATKQALVDHMLARGYAAFRVGRCVEPYEHRDEYQCDVLFVPEKSPATAFDEQRVNFRQFLAQRT